MHDGTADIDVAHDDYNKHETYQVSCTRYLLHPLETDFPDIRALNHRPIEVSH